MPDELLLPGGQGTYDMESATDLWQQVRNEARAAFHMLATHVPVQRLRPTR